MEDIKQNSAFGTVWIGVKDSDGKIDGLTPFPELIPTPLLCSAEAKQGWVYEDVEQPKNESLSFSMSATISIEETGLFQHLSDVFLLFSRQKLKRCRQRRKAVRYKRKHRRKH